MTSSLDAPRKQRVVGAHIGSGHASGTAFYGGTDMLVQVTGDGLKSSCAARFRDNGVVRSVAKYTRGYPS